MLIVLLLGFFCREQTLSKWHTQVHKQQRGSPQSGSDFAFPPQIILISKYSKITQLKYDLVNFLVGQTCCTLSQLFLAEPGEKSAFIIQPSSANYEQQWASCTPVCEWSSFPAFIVTSGGLIQKVNEMWSEWGPDTIYSAGRDMSPWLPNGFLHFTQLFPLRKSHRYGLPLCPPENPQHGDTVL